MGLLHTDNPSTPNMSLDVMEPVRPSLDAWFLSFLEKRIFTRSEFYEMQDGSVRLAGHLRQELSAFGPVAFSLVAPWAENVAHTLEKEFKGKVTLATSLTQNNRKNGRNPYRVKTKKQNNTPKVENRCIQCGKPANGDNLYCSDCFPDRKAELDASFTKAGVNHLKGLREKGITPAHEGEAGRISSETQKTAWAARKEWEQANPGRLKEEKERFIREIQPMSQDFSITELAKVCHCSLRYASQIKKGERVPHPVFYKDLEMLIIQKAHETQL